MESFIRRIEILMIAREQRDNLHLPRQKLFRRSPPQQREKNQPPLCIIYVLPINVVGTMQIGCIIIEDTSSVTPDLLFATMEHGWTANAYCIAPEYLPKIRNVLFHPRILRRSSTHEDDAFNALLAIPNGTTSDMDSAPMVPWV